jgi:hypothetical protein
MRVHRGFQWLMAVAAAVLLSGCATSLIVDNDVQTFSQLRTMPQPATYRFERLPSQQAAGVALTPLEAAAEPALAKAGWVRDERTARYSVQVDTVVQNRVQVVDPWAYSRFGPYPYGRRWAGAGLYGPHFGLGWHSGYDNSYSQREVSLIIRDLSNHQVVYETRAVHSARWPGDPALLTPMFDAALSSFPQPPAGVRRVNIEVPLEQK